MRRFCHFYPYAGRLVRDEGPAFFAAQHSQTGLGRLEKDGRCSTRALCLLDETQRQIAAVIDVSLLGMLCRSVQRLVCPRSLGEEARRRCYLGKAGRLQHLRDAIAQTVADVGLGLGKVVPDAWGQVERIQQIRLVQVGRVKESGEVKHVAAPKMSWSSCSGRGRTSERRPNALETVEISDRQAPFARRACLDHGACWSMQLRPGQEPSRLGFGQAWPCRRWGSSRLRGTASACSPPTTPGLK